MDTNSLEAIFDRAIKAKGGRLDPNSCDPVLKKHIDLRREVTEDWIQYVQVNHLPKMPHVHFDFVDSTLFSASVFEAEGHEFMCLNKGTMVVLYTLFYRMLAMPELFTTLGNFRLEVNGPSLLPLFPTPDASALLSLTDCDKPLDIARRAYAELLAELAIGFLVGHEYGHLAQGHLQFRNTVNSAKTISELGWSTSDGMTSLTQQTLEIDADSHAAAQGLERLFGMVKDSHRLSNDINAVFKNPRLALHTWLFAVHCLFRLENAERMSRVPLETKNYPPPQIRQHLVYMSMEQFIDRHSPVKFLASQNSDDRHWILRDMNFGVIAEVELAFAVLVGVEPDFDRHSSEGEGKVAQKHLDALNEVWREVRPELRRFARTGAKM